MIEADKEFFAKLRSDQAADNLRLAVDDSFYLEATAAAFANREDIHGRRHYERLLRIAKRLKNTETPAPANTPKE